MLKRIKPFCPRGHSLLEVLAALSLIGIAASSLSLLENRSMRSLAHSLKSYGEYENLLGWSVQDLSTSECAQLANSGQTRLVECYKYNPELNTTSKMVLLMDTN